ncbi:cytochrome P450 [Amycolatopsis azurea]|uniref:Cytochrome P450 n=1 Tax=Amycolatopsis azurea DSM 43854 TaxID=1238180 RepID=M2QC94_9PSEU|nr:cytochrome P450 [Amycolatopsis azurea]EMD23707.1 cytochrome P450 [Amycolatopsis azurea DSM 43854]OOC02963.1 cytochrome P450 [Amycolatopsis azurea DSM 43854]
MLIKPVGRDVTHLEHPPGPRLPWPVQTVLFTWKRHLWALRLREKYGDVIVLRVYPWRTVVFICDPEHIAAMFASPPPRFRMGEGSSILRTVLGGHSLILSDDEEHRRLRRLMAPAFGKSAVRGYRDTVRALAEREVRSWPTGRPVNSLARMRALTLEVIWRVLFGAVQGAHMDRLRVLITRLPATDLVILLGLDKTFVRDRGPWRRAARALKEIDSLIYRTIEEQRQSPDLERRTDVLSRLLSASDRGEHLTSAEIRDQIITLLYAGHETTATTLAWALHELARNAEVARAATRATLTDDTAYLEAVVKETMRRRPSVFELTWTLTEDVELAGFRLPKGATLMPLIGIVHMDPRNYPDARAFRPERFLRGDVPAHVFLPFGGGVRRCIGANLATLEAVEVLRTVLSLRALSAHRPGPERAVCKNVTITPADGARIIAKPLPASERAL